MTEQIRIKVFQYGREKSAMSVMTAMMQGWNRSVTETRMVSGLLPDELSCRNSRTPHLAGTGSMQPAAIRA